MEGENIILVGGGGGVRVLDRNKSMIMSQFHRADHSDFYLLDNKKKYIFRLTCENDNQKETSNFCIESSKYLP